MSKILQATVLVAVSLASQACYRGRVVAFPPPTTPGQIRADVPPGTFDKTQKVNLYFWGLLQNPPSPVRAENCPTQSMKEVTVSRKGSYGTDRAPQAKTRSISTGAETAGPGRSRSAGSQTAAGTVSPFGARPRLRSRTSYAPSTRNSPRASARPRITRSSSA